MRTDQGAAADQADGVKHVMLNTDLCLLYRVDRPVPDRTCHDGALKYPDELLETGGCCAWMSPSSAIKWEDIPDYLKGDSIRYCGYDINISEDGTATTVDGKPFDMPLE